ncbi:uncharacterized protein LOC130038782 isoform X1 [Sorex fumeus]|uniref:uncharacterized protein LOC130038782 isoform X1 n=1 Tax=Sorex fumeus TaxID=62283 RepID=UPI0024AE3C1E|nr:uncharacterized protein LOC130038782 isoform X1 [Sorex fumeus]
MYYKFSGFTQKLAGAWAADAYSPQGLRPAAPREAPPVVFATPTRFPRALAADEPAARNRVPELQRLFQEGGSPGDARFLSGTFWACPGWRSDREDGPGEGQRPPVRRALLAAAGPHADTGAEVRAWHRQEGARSFCSCRRHRVDPSHCTAGPVGAEPPWGCT